MVMITTMKGRLSGAMGERPTRSTDRWRRHGTFCERLEMYTSADMLKEGEQLSKQKCVNFDSVRTTYLEKFAKLPFRVLHLDRYRIVGIVVVAERTTDVHDVA